MLRRHSITIAFLLLLVSASLAAGRGGALRVEIETPGDAQVLDAGQRTVRVTGGASVFGGVRRLDIFLVLDTSKSLRRTDPEDYRARGAADLVRSIPTWSDVRFGVVSFDRRAELALPLTRNREAVVEAVEDLDRWGATDLAGGIRAALEGFELGGRPDSTRVILLFTDGKSDAEEAREQMRAAHRRGVVVHALQLGDDRKGSQILQEVARGTGGSYVQVSDPSELPQAFLDLRTTGIDRVTLRVDGGETIPTRLFGNAFSADVPVREGVNRIVAVAHSLDGRESQDSVSVTVRGVGCAELEVEALRDGRRALSLAERSVEIVFDASGSMWGQLDGESKISIAKQSLTTVLGSLPEDLQLALRVYGHQHPKEERNCGDSELLVPTGVGNRARIRQAIAGFRPRGQTPLAHSLRQLARDFSGFQGERAVVLVTDGIESCGGDPVAEARALQRQTPTPIHVIGFGLRGADADIASLRGIAEASGGRFIAAQNSEELREALEVTVGTPYAVWRDDHPVARGTLGSGEILRLPGGDYTLKLDSSPPSAIPLALTGQERLELVLERKDGGLSARARRGRAEWSDCADPLDSAIPAARAPWPDHSGRSVRDAAIRGVLP